MIFASVLVCVRLGAVHDPVTGMEPLTVFAVSIAPFIVLDVVKMSRRRKPSHMLKVAVPALRHKKI